MARVSVSVIIPVYNVALCVERCIKSVMLQTVEADECIIIDDCSTDDSITLCQRMIDEYKGKTRFTILHHKQNRGLSAARNTGTEHATGEYIYYLDSDDEMATDCLEKLVAPIENDSEVEMVIGEYKTYYSLESRYFKKDIVKESHFFKNSPKTLQTKKEVIDWYYHKKGSRPDQGWNKLLRLSFIKENKLYFKEGLLYEDILWSHYLFNCLSHVAFVPSITYLHYWRQGSIMTQTKYDKYLLHHGYIFKEVAEYLRDDKCVEKTLRWISDFSDCYIDASDNPDYQYAYSVFRKNVSDKHHRLVVWRLTLVDTLRKNGLGRLLYRKVMWIRHQIRRMCNVVFTA